MLWILLEAGAALALAGLIVWLTMGGKAKNEGKSKNDCE